MRSLYWRPFPLARALLRFAARLADPERANLAGYERASCSSVPLLLSFSTVWRITLGDLIGFIEDNFEERTRVMKILHVPGTWTTFNFRGGIQDYIYVLERDAYDENIL